MVDKTTLLAIKRRQLRALKEQEVQLRGALSSHQNSLLGGRRLEQSYTSVLNKIEILTRELENETPSTD